MNRQQASYRQILRASSIVGGASVINLLLQIIRIKVLAILLGPGGMGLMGMFSSILATASSISALGLGSSGVREIAAARSSGDERCITVIHKAIRIATLLLACVGAMLLYLFRERIALASFGHTRHAGEIGWLAIGLLASVATVSLGAVLQGYRRIGDQARIQLLGGVTSTLVAIAVIWFWGANGIVYFVIAMPFAGILFNYYFVKKLPQPTVKVSAAEVAQQIKTLLHFGIFLMAAGVLQQLVLLSVKAKITHVWGIEATGIFQASWSLAFVYMGIVLSAMGQDYYPRLTEIIRDKKAANVLVNEQLHVALVMTLPVLLMMMSFSGVLIQLLFSKAFLSGTLLIQWMTLGNLMRVAAWPLAYVILARGKSGAFFFTELVWNGSFFLGVLVGLEPLGQPVLGQMYALAGLCYLGAVLVASRWLIDFRFRLDNRRLLLIATGLCVLLFIGDTFMPGTSRSLAVVLVVGSIWYAWKQLGVMLGENPWLALRKKPSGKPKP